MSLCLRFIVTATIINIVENWQSLYVIDPIPSFGSCDISETKFPPNYYNILTDCAGLAHRYATFLCFWDVEI